MAKRATFLCNIVWAIILFWVGLCSGRTFSGNDTQVTLTPVIIIPGHGGNQILMKVDRREPIVPGCVTSSDGWTLGWLDLWKFLPQNLNCWAEHNKLSYDEKSGEYHKMEGVKYRIPDWGGVKSIEYLDPSVTAYLLGNIGSYFVPVIRKLEYWGYEAGKNIRAAPYDFRYSPVSMPNFYDPLRRLVEDTYKKNGNTRVALLAHSMGGLLAHYFVQKQSPQWRKKYIHSLITLNTPWGGVVDMLEAMVSGYTWALDLHPNTFRIMQRTCEAGVFLLPTEYSWDPDATILSSGGENYTVKDYDKLFQDIGYPAGSAMRRKVRRERLKLDNPGVNTWCFYASGIDTPETLVYPSGKFPDGPPQRIMGIGDGTANLRSANLCTKWRDTTEGVIKTKQLIGVTHAGILSNDEIHEDLKEILISTTKSK
ncbi:hypothetical protein LSH36_605g03014 [Paralvinella palmiformis]|uniref:Uncharacterized protein n=1 Tax=Paralvinella palmiformis TaxID=53620 RepID=A0AAD9J5F9_9ANNE|nr:hypothetical protein LSH36_605g03014 [Paralvinella palmiformis]